MYSNKRRNKAQRELDGEIIPSDEKKVEERNDIYGGTSTYYNDGSSSHHSIMGGTTNYDENGEEC